MKHRRNDRDDNGSQKTDWAFVEMILASPSVRTIYFYGPPGVGKTYAAYRKGRINAGVHAVTLTEDTCSSELRGHYIPVGNDAVWHDGPFTTGMRTGSRLVVNELTHGSADVHSLLHPVLESFETARMTLPTNETVRPKSGFHVICTDNAPPEALSDALRDRFDVTLEITEPHPEALALLSPTLRQAALRSLRLEPERRIGLRNWMTVQRLSGEFGLARACTAVFGWDRGARIHDALILSKSKLDERSDDEERQG